MSTACSMTSGLSSLSRQPHASPAQDELAARLRALDLIPTVLAKLLENYRADVRSARNA